MATNPDNVGGLPPLLHFAVFDEFGKGADDRVWDYGRRCFEAGMKFEGEHGLMTTNAPKRDSAPAGSGEAGPILIHAQQLHLDGHMDQCALDELTALLRKLQQGAEHG